jgi:hypothetical protein
MSNARVTRNQRINLPRRRDMRATRSTTCTPSTQPGKTPRRNATKARLTVVWLAGDADDARTLLDALGLL